MLGIGLAMDAFSVSMANGLNEPKMSSKKFFGIAFTFAAFQFIMPVIGCIFAIASVRAKEQRNRIAAGGMTAGYWGFWTIGVLISMISALSATAFTFPNMITYLPTILEGIFFVFYGLMAVA